MNGSAKSGKRRAAQPYISIYFHLAPDLLSMTLTCPPAERDVKPPTQSQTITSSFYEYNELDGVTNLIFTVFDLRTLPEDDSSSV